MNTGSQSYHTGIEIAILLTMTDTIGTLNRTILELKWVKDSKHNTGDYSQSYHTGIEIS